jgi:hypothetical protein
MYNILPIQSLLYVREFWTIKQIDVRRLKTAEMKFMGHTTGYSLLDHRRNEDVLELKVNSVENKLSQYKQKWLIRISRMEDIKYPEQLREAQIGFHRLGILHKRFIVQKLAGSTALV